MTALLLTATLLLAAGALVLEGRTILVCVRGLGPGGARTLTRLGAGFLVSEVWVVALLAVAHAVRPTDWHALLGAGPAALTLYGAGWVLRDAGLWFGPRTGAGRSFWRALVGLGAVAQLAGAVGVVAALIRLDWQHTPPTGAAVTVLAVVVPGCVVLAAAVQTAGWWWLRNTWDTVFFAWTGPLRTPRWTSRRGRGPGVGQGARAHSLRWVDE